MWRFTDNARSAIRAGFGSQPTAIEQAKVASLARQPRGVAHRLLKQAGVAADDLDPATVPIERRVLVKRANEEARRRGTRYVGSEHVLLALARLPGSELATCGASHERIDKLLSEAEGEARTPHPRLARRGGEAARTALAWLRGPR